MHQEINNSRHQEGLSMRIPRVKNTMRLLLSKIHLSSM